MIRNDLTGQAFGKLKVIKYFGRNKDRQSLYECKCECGIIKVVPSRYLKDGQSQSCGCIMREKTRKLRLLDYGLASKRALYLSYKSGARVRDLEFNLSFDEFIKLTSDVCHYDGTKPKQIFGRKNCNGIYIYNGIDRIDNKSGYIIENCVSCCKTCNIAKMSMTQQEFYEWIDRVSLWRAGI